MSDNFDLHLFLLIDIENGDGEIIDGVLLSRRIQLPYIPQIGSDIVCTLHREHNGRKKFTVKCVETPLGYWTNKPIEKNYELVESTVVYTENRFPLSEIIEHWNVRSVDHLVDICRTNGWVVSYDRTNVKSEILTKMKQDEETLISTLQKFEEKWGKKNN